MLLTNETALCLASRLAGMDPMVMRQTKAAINRTYEIMGLEQALATALDIDLQIEGEGSDDKREFLRRAREQGLPPLIMLVTSLAVGIALREAVKEFFPEGANPHAFVSPYSYRNITVGGVILDHTQIGLIVCSLAMVYAVYLVVTKTWIGHAMRATSEDLDAARMMGVEVDAVIRNTFLLGSALGGAAGVMNGLYYLSIRFDMGWVMAIKGFTAAVIGGLGNVYGAMFGGYVLAIVEVLIVALIPEGSRYKDVGVFLLLILVLVFRPSGSFAPHRRRWAETMPESDFIEGQIAARDVRTRAEKLGERVLVAAFEGAVYGLVLLGMALEELGLLLAYLAAVAAGIVAWIRLPSTGRRVRDLFRRNAGFARLFLVLLLVSYPVVFQGNPYLIHLGALAAIFAIMALGLNISLGFCGLLDVGFAVYFAAGAYTSAQLEVLFGWSFWTGLACLSWPPPGPDGSATSGLPPYPRCRRR